MLNQLMLIKKHFKIGYFSCTKDHNDIFFVTLQKITKSYSDTKFQSYECHLYVRAQILLRI